MRHQKRFCVNCNEETSLVIQNRGKYSMYRCRQCGDEVCRVGDGDSHHNTKTIPGGLDSRSMPDWGHSSYLGDTYIAKHNPDVLSDDHTMWPPRNDEADFKKQLQARFLPLVLEKLTDRQKEILATVEKTGTQAEAAKQLGLSFQTVSGTIKAIQKKFDKIIRERNKQGKYCKEDIA